MSRYYINEAAFELPDIGLRDDTVHRIETWTPETGQVALRVQRGAIPEGKTLADVVSAGVRNADIRLRAHRVVMRRELEIAGCPAIEIGAEWRGADSTIYTRSAYLAIDRRWIVFAGNAPIAERVTCDEMLDRALATFRLRDRS